jgi:integrase
MKGRIYSDQKCELCKSNFKWDGNTGLYCPNHPDQQATAKFKVMFRPKSEPQICRRFTNYDDAETCLLGIRHEHNEGRFDPRDYSKEKPLGFENLSKQWLERKRGTVKAKTLKGLETHIGHAVQVWSNRNIKTIQYAELEDFLFPISKDEPLYKLSDKTRANVRSTLHSFWTWLVKRRILDSMPEFPEVSFYLKFRNIVTKVQQNTILAKLKEQTYHLNPKIWLAVKWLATYFNLRPGELLNIQEKHIDLDHGRILIPHPKEKTPKYVFLIDEDIQFLRSLPRAFPELYFFRHTKGNGGAKPGQKFGKCFLYNCWKRACDAVGIKDVDLYGGTRHTTMVELRKRHSPEAIKRGAGTQTNKAFDRYLQVTADELRPLYQDARSDNVLITDFEAGRTKKAK